MTTLADFALGLGLEGECLMKTEDIMLALGLTTNLEPVPAPALQMRERRRTGDPYARMRFEPEPDSYSDRSRSRKAARTAPTIGSAKRSARTNNGNKRNKVIKDNVGAGMMGGRKLYLCRWCGLPKKNHTCEGAVDPATLASRQQAARGLSSGVTRRDAMSSSSSTGSTADDDDMPGGGDEDEQEPARPAKLPAAQQARQGACLTVETFSYAMGAEFPAGIQAVGKRIEGVFLCEGGLLQWYGGLITEFSESDGEHLVVYDDGEQKWHNLAEGVAQQTLRWPSGADVWEGRDESPDTARVPADQRKITSPSSRKRRERPVEPEPVPVEVESAPAQVCDYCSSRGKVHRRCLRLPTCHIIWKRGGKGKKRDPSADLSELRRAAPSTPPTPGAEQVRIGRTKEIPHGKRAQVQASRSSEAAAIAAAMTAAETEAEDEPPSEYIEEFVPVQCSQKWPFPVIVAPEALGYSFPGDDPTPAESAQSLAATAATDDDEATVCKEAEDILGVQPTLSVEP